MRRFFSPHGFLLVTLVPNLAVRYLTHGEPPAITRLLDASVMIAVTIYVVEHSVERTELMLPAVGRLLVAACVQYYVVHCGVARAQFLLRHPERAPQEPCPCWSGKLGRDLKNLEG